MTPAASTLPAEARRGLGAWNLPRSAVAWLAVMTFVTIALLAVLLITPGRSFIGIYVNDLMVFYDGAHRILEGQVPNRDFHTPLGPLAYLLPAFGLWAGGSLGSMLPIATGAFAVLLALPLFYVSATRLPFPLAAAVILYVTLLAVAPLNPGDSWQNTTFAMFYNRFCWSALTVLLVLALPGVRFLGHDVALDALCATWLLVVLFYLKLSYAAVGGAFLIALLLLPSHRRFAAFALIGTAVVLLLVEAVWRETGRYLSDASTAASISGTVRGGAYQIALTIGQNMHQEAVYGAALLLGFVRRTRPVYLLASVIMATAGLLLLNQNAQLLEIPLLVPAALTATLGPATPADPAASQRLRVATLLLVGALVLPGIANGALALRFFRHELNHTPQFPGQIAELDGVVTHEGTLTPADGRPTLRVPADALAKAIRSGVSDTQTMLLLRQIRSQQPLSQSEYLTTLHDGAAVLRATPGLTGPIYTFDLQNPFNAILDRRPPRGDSSWNHFGRTFDQKTFLPPEIALADIQVIMDPKDPMEVYSARGQEMNYASYLAKHFQLAANSTYWRVYSRRNPDRAPPP
jgi:hypothetical protein